MAQWHEKGHEKARDGPNFDSLTEKQRRALAALFEAKSVKEAAKLACISERQMKRYRADPTFKAAYKAAQYDLLENAVNQSRRNLSGALGALAEIAENADEQAAARVSAARATVELALRLGEQVDILKQLQDLEQWRKEYKDERR